MLSITASPTESKVIRSTPSRSRTTGLRGVCWPDVRWKRFLILRITHRLSGLGNFIFGPILEVPSLDIRQRPASLHSLCSLFDQAGRGNPAETISSNGQAKLTDPIKHLVRIRLAQRRLEHVVLKVGIVA